MEETLHQYLNGSVARKENVALDNIFIDQLINLCGASLVQDHRASAEYRRSLLQVAIEQGLTQLLQKQHKEDSE